jgi:hypothetical protein
MTRAYRIYSRRSNVRWELGRLLSLLTVPAGVYHIPSHLSEGAKHLVKRMLTTDPVKRATISEIRAMPWYQENLPRYLQPLPEMNAYPTLPMDDLSTLLLINEGQTDPREVAESTGLLWTEDLGIVDPMIIEELLDKIRDFSPDMVWSSLQAEGDNQVKVAYQLLRDQKRMLQDSKSLSSTPGIRLTMRRLACTGGRRPDCYGRILGIISTSLECQSACCKSIVLLCELY